MNKMGPLSALASKYGSDKWGQHSYTPHYELHFAPFRDRKLNLLEIGVGGYHVAEDGGSSLRMWRDYFPLANIFALDYFDKSPHANERVKIYQGDQSDREVLTRIHEEAGGLDIVIDDGSHENSHVITSFEILFPLLNPQGIYVIEDIQTSYWPKFGGSSSDFNSRSTSVGYFKALVDGLNYREIPREQYEPSVFDKEISSIHFYHNMIFVYKGDNSEESNILKNFKLPPSLEVDETRDVSEGE